MSGYRKSSAHSQNSRSSVNMQVSEATGLPGYRRPVVTTYTEEEILNRLGPARTYHIDVVHPHPTRGGGKKK